MLIDTHTHLYLRQFAKDRAETIQRAIDKGVERFYLPNIDRKSIDDMLELEERYPDRCFAMMGLHPCSVKEDYKKELAIVHAWLKKRPFCAIGEIGIDLYWDKTFIEEQKEAFRTQIAWAKELNLPIVIHARDALDIIIRIVQEEKDDRLRGIFHCFTGTKAQADAIIELGFYLGIGGVLTFKKAKLDEVLVDIPLKHIVLETDSPYLAPVPYRGKRNESAYVYYVAERLAEIKNISIEQIISETGKNAKLVFNKP